MEMPLPDVLDRLSIVNLKIERIGDSHLKKEKEALEKALNDYKKKVKVDDNWLSSLYEINGKIWDLESDIRKGRDKELGLEEVGRRAIKIRELNKCRVSVKNEIAKVTKVGFIDIKMNHASE